MLKGTVKPLNQTHIVYFSSYLPLLMPSVVMSAFSQLVDGNKKHWTNSTAVSLELLVRTVFLSTERHHITAQRETIYYI